MPDFRVQFLEGVVPGSTQTLDISTPPLMGIDNFANVFLIPAAYPHITAGVGRASGGATADALPNTLATVEITAIDNAHFDDNSAASVQNTLVGTHVIEYIGPANGPNEVKVRAVKVFSGSAGSFDSTAISGITSLSKCVPFSFMVGNLNSGAWSAHSAQVEVVNDGTNNVVRVTKSNTTDTLNLVVYVVEFTGSNWTVQKVAHTFSAAATNEDDTISSVTNVNQAFVYSTPFFTGAQPKHNLYYAWLSSTTNLRQWIAALSGATKTVSYVIRNPQQVVTVIGADPDGTADLNATGSAPETRNLTISSQPNWQSMLVLGFAGSDYTTVGDRPGVCTLFNLTSSTNLQLRRTVTTGNTEYKIQLIDWTGLAGSEITSVDPITDTLTFVIHGAFSSISSVKINDVSQTIDSSDADSIEVTAVLGSNKYGQPYDLVVVDGGVTLTWPAVVINAPAGKQFVNLAPPLAPTAGRITAVTDLSGFEQLEWSLVVGGNGNTTDVIVYADAAFSVFPSVSQFSVRANDGTGWGTIGVQLVAAPIPPKVKTLTCPTLIV